MKDVCMNRITGTSILNTKNTRMKMLTGTFHNANRCLKTSLRKIFIGKSTILEHCQFCEIRYYFTWLEVPGTKASIHSILVYD